MSFDNRRGRGMDRNSFRHSSSRSSRSRTRRDTKRIDPSLYTQAVTKEEDRVVENKKTFDSYGLHKSVVENINERGYLHATHIQDQVIPHVMEQKDVIGLAQTGSGKTGSYLIPLLHNVVAREKENPHQVTLIIVPTRELAFQVESELYEFGIKKLRLFSVVCVGGMNLGDQVRKLRKPNQFVIGTPGRLMDLAKRGILKLDKVTTVVVDEVDRMLDMGFIDDINWIMGEIPESRQGLFFSATFNKNIAPILGRLAPNAHMVKIEGQQKPSPNVEQTMVHVHDRRSKMDTLFNLIKDEPEGVKALVFINTKSEVERVTQFFQEEGLETVYLHGDKQQKQRMRTIQDFKRMKTGFLIATDVAARGLDIDDITHVYNYDEPQDIDTYIHRIGRTGRAGRFGKAVTLVVK